MKNSRETAKYLFLIQIVLMLSASLVPMATQAQVSCPVWGCQPYAPLTVSCYSNYSGNVLVNTNVNWYSVVSGGNGFYSYAWNGTDGLIGNNNQISTTYSLPGSKAAFVSVTSGGQTVTANCGTINIYLPSYNYNYYYPSTSQVTSGSYYYAGSNNSVPTNTGTVYTSNNNTGTTNQVLGYSATNPNLQSVYLSNVPYTGAGDVARVLGFISILVLWSAVLSYIFLKRREQEQLLTVTESAGVGEQNVQSHVAANSNILESIETIARNNKVILSSEAVVKIAKLQQLENINPSELISKISKGEWMTCGEKDIEKYI